MARKRVARREPRGRKPCGQKAKGEGTARPEEKEAGESEATLGLEGDADEDPETGPVVGSGLAGPLEVEGGGR